MYSIRRRLNYSIIAIIVTLFMLQWFMVQYAIQHLTEEIVLTRLQHDAESILAEIQFDAESQVALPAGRLAHVYDRPFSGHYYLVHKKDSRLRSRSLWDWDIKTPELPSGQSKVDIAVGPLSQQLMILHNGFTKNNIHLVISVGEDVTDLLEDEKELLVAYASASVAALIGLILFQMIILSRGLAPAATATKQLSAMERGEIKSLDEDVPLEIHPLVVEINRLMKLLTQRIQRSRNALGNLAHAYKTPLSAINQLVSSHSGLDDETKQQLLNQVNLMKRLTDRELKRARLSGDVNLGQFFKPNSDVQGLLKIFEHVFPDTQIELRVSSDADGQFTLDREDMLEILGNLIENACKWAQQKVLVEFKIQNKQLHVIVEDDGPGVNDEMLHDLATRGVRIDESTHGHGLGLAIVKDAIEHYQGKLEFSRAQELGGFRVDMFLPCIIK